MDLMLELEFLEGSRFVFLLKDALGDFRSMMLG